MDDLAPDFISNLPDALLSSIISHLSLKEIVRTSILSTRWKQIWKSSSSLHFDTKVMKLDDNHGERKRAGGLVERVIASHETKLVTCSICHVGEDFRSGLVERLIKYLKEKKRVEELALTCEKSSIPDNGKLKCNLPSGIFFCRTLRVLELNGYRLKDASPFQSCRNLVTLRLNSVRLNDKTLTTVVFNCMFLEDLRLCSCTGLKLVEIRDQNLKFLKLKDLDLKQVDIQAKGLSVLVFDSVSCERYVKMNTPSLIEFGLYCDDYVHRRRSSYPRIIDLLERCCGLLHQNSNDGFLLSNPFANLHKICTSLVLEGQMENHILDHIFRLCTHLQILKINIPKHRTSDTNWELPYPTFMFWEIRELYDSITHFLKVVEIRGFCGKEKEIAFAKHLIRKAPMLRTFVIECDEVSCTRRGADATFGLLHEPKASINLSIVLKPEVHGSFQNWVSAIKKYPYS